jgi:hypothetical protein
MAAPRASKTSTGSYRIDVQQFLYMHLACAGLVASGEKQGEEERSDCRRKIMDMQEMGEEEKEEGIRCGVDVAHGLLSGPLLL